MAGQRIAWRSKPAKPDGKIKPQAVVQALWKVTNGDAIITNDVGQHQMWAALVLPVQQAVAGSTPAAWAPWALASRTRWAQLANPDATVACITGEGSVRMCIQAVDLQTVSHDEDHQPEQPLARHGAAVAGVLLRQPLRRVTWTCCRISSSSPKPATSA